MPTSLLQLTGAMAAGDEPAIEAFYRAYFAWLYQKARRATGRDEAFCLDVVQESVLRILRCVRPTEGERPFRAWLRLVVQSTAYDLLKSESRRVRREAVVAVPCGDDTPEEPQDCAEQLAWLRNQLVAMDPEIARMIDLRFQKSWTLARIARLFGLSVGTIDGRLRRAVGRLRELAKEEFDDGL
ncbi:MAG: RNA polymerase sigma factor [Thermoguttaceae bacterium]